jgi:Flp pilus assembly protein TadD
MPHLSLHRRPAARIVASVLLAALLLGGCARLQNFSFRRAPASGTAAVSTAPPDMATLRSAVAATPNNAIAQARLADAAETAGLHAEAAAALVRVVALDGTTPERMVRLGGLRLRAGERAAAEEAFVSARAQSPRHAPALAGLALAYDLGGDRARAQDAYRQALAIAPGDWTIRGNQALSLLLAGRSRDAERALAAAERDAATPRRARHNLALVLAARGEHARVVRLLRLDMGPGEAEALALEFRGFADWLAAAPPGDAGAALFQPATVAVAAGGGR